MPEPESSVQGVSAVIEAGERLRQFVCHTKRCAYARSLHVRFPLECDCGLSETLAAWEAVQS